MSATAALPEGRANGAQDAHPPQDQRGEQRAQRERPTHRRGIGGEAQNPHFVGLQAEPAKENSNAPARPVHPL